MQNKIFICKIKCGIWYQQVKTTFIKLYSSLQRFFYYLKIKYNILHILRIFVWSFSDLVFTFSQILVENMKCCDLITSCYYINCGILSLSATNLAAHTSLVSRGFSLKVELGMRLLEKKNEKLGDYKWKREWKGAKGSLRLVCNAQPLIHFSCFMLCVCVCAPAAFMRSICSGREYVRLCICEFIQQF